MTPRREFARRVLIGLAASALLLAAVPLAGAREREATSDNFVSSQLDGAGASMSAVSPLPARPPLYGMTPPSVVEGQIGAAPNLGPVTGYGRGGMEPIPGSPPNPPYR